MVTIDSEVKAGIKNFGGFGGTLGIREKVGPFDRRLALHLDRLCKDNHLCNLRDFFKHFRSDLFAAVAKCINVRIALVSIG